MHIKHRMYFAAYSAHEIDIQNVQSFVQKTWQAKANWNACTTEL